MLYVFAGLVCLAALLPLLFRGRIRLAPVSYLLAVAAAVSACLLAAVGLKQGLLFARYTAAPEETAAAFFEDMLAGDYEKAYSLLANYSDLGLDGTLSDGTSEELYAALRDSYAYRLAGPAELQGLSAVQKVDFTSLDVSSLQEDLRGEILARLAKLVDELPYDEVYDEKDQYRPEITERAYREAVSALLAHRSDYERSETLSVSLRYDESGWRLLADDALLRALSGTWQR